MGVRPRTDDDEALACRFRHALVDDFDDAVGRCLAMAAVRVRAGIDRNRQGLPFDDDGGVTSDENSSFAIGLASPCARAGLSSRQGRNARMNLGEGWRVANTGKRTRRSNRNSEKRGVHAISN